MKMVFNLLSLVYSQKISFLEIVAYFSFVGIFSAISVIKTGNS